MGKRGRAPNTIFSRVWRLSLTREFSDLLPLFQELERLPRGRRNAALLAALRGGTAAAHNMIAQKENRRSARAVDSMLSMFDLDDSTPAN